MLRFALLVLALTCGNLRFAGPAAAQSYGRVQDTETNVPSYFFHVRPGEPTTRVYVWGTVRAPGVYEVGEGTSLGEVLSLAGGPVAAPLQDRDRREVTIRVFHVEGGARTVAYEAPIEQFVREPERYPALSDGDVVEVATRDIRARDWRETLAVVGSLTGVATLIVQLVTLAR